MTDPGTNRSRPHSNVGAGMDDMASGEWQTRIGQIETVLTYFGSLCSVSVTRCHVGGAVRTADVVYMQASRVDGGIEVEMTGNHYLKVAQLTPAQEAWMVAAGWAAPELPASPNFSRFLAEYESIHELAINIAGAFAGAYGIDPDAPWEVSPPEFGNQDAGLAPLEILGLDEDDAEDQPITGADLAKSRTRILREGSGAILVPVVASAAVTWDELMEAGLPRGDHMAEMAMLYRTDCPAEFLRRSAFKLNVLEDPALPIRTVLAVLAANPTAWELKTIAKRGDIAREELAKAAVRGAKLANWRGRAGGDFLAMNVVPTARLHELARQQDADAVGMLRHPRCPEDIVIKHVLARSARVRYAALAATKRRDLAVDSALIRLASTVPMTERAGISLLFAPRVCALVDEILAAR